MDRPVHRFDHSLADRKTQARAAVFAAGRTVRLLEGLEDDPLLVLREQLGMDLVCPDLARNCLAEELAKSEARRAVRAETEEAMEDLTGLADEGLTWRLAQTAEARHRSERPKLDDTSDMGEDRAALSAGLQRMIDTAIWQKKR